jgi:hypothetical protein
MNASNNGDDQDTQQGVIFTYTFTPNAPASTGCMTNSNSQVSIPAGTTAITVAVACGCSDSSGYENTSWNYSIV